LKKTLKINKVSFSLGKHKVLFIFCILWFIFLCFLHFLSARPLWLDENLIFENIKTFSFSQLLGPLKNSQAFPRIYLIIIKSFSKIFNYNVFSLRLIPLLSMISAFFVWIRIYRKEFSNNWHFLLVLLPFISSYSLSYYASELKPYSIDVLVVGIFCLYLINQKKVIEKGLSKAFIIVTLALPFTILLSYGSFFIFWIVIYNFLYIVRANRKVLPLLLTYTFLSLSAISFVYFFDLRHTLLVQPLFDYWNDYFLSLDSFRSFIKSFGEGIRKLAVWWFGNSTFFRRAASPFIPLFAFSLFGYGINSIRKNRFKLINISAIGLVIFAELFILGLIKKYPFTGERITLFFAPFVFYFIVKSLDYIRKNKFLYISFNIFYVAFFLACSINSFSTYLQFYK